MYFVLLSVVKSLRVVKQREARGIWGAFEHFWENGTTYNTMQFYPDFLKLF